MKFKAAEKILKLFGRDHSLLSNLRKNIYRIDTKSPYIQQIDYLLQQYGHDASRKAGRSAKGHYASKLKERNQLSTVGKNKILPFRSLNSGNIYDAIWPNAHAHHILGLKSFRIDLNNVLGVRFSKNIAKEEKFKIYDQFKKHYHISDAEFDELIHAKTPEDVYHAFNKLDNFNSVGKNLVILPADEHTFNRPFSIHGHDFSSMLPGTSFRQLGDNLYIGFNKHGITGLYDTTQMMNNGSFDYFKLIGDVRDPKFLESVLVGPKINATNKEIITELKYHDLIEPAHPKEVQDVIIRNTAARAADPNRAKIDIYKAIKRGYVPSEYYEYLDYLPYSNDSRLILEIMKKGGQIKPSNKLIKKQ